MTRKLSRLKKESRRGKSALDTQSLPTPNIVFAPNSSSRGVVSSSRRKQAFALRVLGRRTTSRNINPIPSLSLNAVPCCTLRPLLIIPPRHRHFTGVIRRQDCRTLAISSPSTSRVSHRLVRLRRSIPPSLWRPGWRWLHLQRLTSLPTLRLDVRPVRERLLKVADAARDVFVSLDGKGDDRLLCDELALECGAKTCDVHDLWYVCPQEWWSDR